MLNFLHDMLLSLHAIDICGSVLERTSPEFLNCGDHVCIHRFQLPNARWKPCKCMISTANLQSIVESGVHRLHICLWVFACTLQLTLSWLFDRSAATREGEDSLTVSAGVGRNPFATSTNGTTRSLRTLQLPFIMMYNSEGGSPWCAMIWSSIKISWGEIVHKSKSKRFGTDSPKILIRLDTGTSTRLWHSEGDT